MFNFDKGDGTIYEESLPDNYGSMFDFDIPDNVVYEESLPTPTVTSNLSDLDFDFSLPADQYLAEVKKDPDSFWKEIEAQYGKIDTPQFIEIGIDANGNPIGFNIDPATKEIWDADGNLIDQETMQPITDPAYYQARLDNYYTKQAAKETVTGLLNQAKQLGTSAVNQAKKFLLNPDESVNWRNLATIGGGLYGLAQSNKPQQPVGYQGGIPQYAAVRAQVPQDDMERRPGSAGRRYFTDLQYVAPGQGGVDFASSGAPKFGAVLRPDGTNYISNYSPMQATPHTVGYVGNPQPNVGDIASYGAAYEAFVNNYVSEYKDYSNPTAAWIKETGATVENIEALRQHLLYKDAQRGYDDPAQITNLIAHSLLYADYVPPAHTQKTEQQQMQQPQPTPQPTPQPAPPSEGGVDFASSGAPKFGAVLRPDGTNYISNYSPMQATPHTVGYAEGGDVGGIASLAKGGAPRYLNGASDGMADKISARIDDGQEARLSHGEFVIPADVVGHLGNGNSEAGAQRLYDMMDNIRKARTGTTKQGKQINPNKFLPS